MLNESTTDRLMKNNNSGSPHVYSKYADFFINKETEYYYSGSNLKFSLSHALFSSYEIDSGSRLLLKTLEPLLKTVKITSILDAGCGTGILGTALKKSSAGSELFLYDRDALAVNFTKLNLEKNGITEYTAAVSLLMFPFSDRKFDLIVSNLPAKAGKKVLGDFIRQAPLHLSREGTAAVVIVKPLSDFALKTLNENKLKITHSVKTANYSVFHFKYSENAETLPDIESNEEMFEKYIRKEKFPFELKGNSFIIDTAEGLSDFDNLSFNTKLSGELLLSIKDKLKEDKRQLVINPGQGLIPVILNSFFSKKNDKDIELFISSNDILQIRMTERNLNNLALSERTEFLSSPTIFDTADIMEAGSIDTIVYFHSSVPCFKKHDLIMKRFNSLLKHGGKIILTSTASEISRFLAGSKGFVNVKGKKNKGIRSVYLKKSADSA